MSEKLGLKNTKTTLPKNDSTNLNLKIRNNAMKALNSKLKTKGSVVDKNFNHDDDEDDDEEKNKNKLPPFSVIYKIAKGYVKKFLDSMYVIIGMLLVTIYVLFVSDVQAAFLSSKLDDSLTVFQVVGLALFSIEFFLYSAFIDNYNFSFYFWLDLISTLSLLTDINFIFKGIINIFVGTESTDLSGTSANVRRTANFSKATKTMKITRIVRIVRIIRLIRIVKLYKAAMLARKRIEEQRQKMILEEAKREEEVQKEKEGKRLFKNKKGNNDNFILNKKRKAIRDKGKKFNKLIPGKKNFQAAKDERKVEILKLRENNLIEEFENNKDQQNEEKDENKKNEEENNDEEIIEKDEVKKEEAHESNLSKVISESITKKVIILILGMVVLMPFFDLSIYSNPEDDYYPNSIAEYLSNYVINKGKDKFNFDKTNLVLQKIITEDSDSSFPILNITYNDSLYYLNSSLNYTDFREGEIRLTNSSDTLVIIYYSVYYDSSLTGLLNIFKTIFIGMLIVYAAITLEDDTKTLVLGPMEIIIEIVETVSKDPQKAKNPENLKFGIKNLINNNDVGKDNELSASSKEAKLIQDKKLAQRQKDLEKYEVMKVQQSIIKISSLLVVGFGDAGCEMIKTIIGHNNKIDLTNKGKKIKGIFVFTHILNLNKIINVINEKATLYLNQISQYVHSSADKFGGTTNKNLGDEILCVWNFKTLKELKQAKLYNKDVKQMADLCLCSIFETIVHIKSRKKIIDWKFDEMIKSKFKKFETSLVFGLHIGGAIEGIVGSDSKLEATYVSRNVGITHKIMELTKVYGVTILLTDSFYTQLSEEMKEVCRLIDVVKFKESLTYLKLYTIDINIELPVNIEEDEIDELPQKEKQIKHLAKKERIRKFLMSSAGDKENKISAFAFSKQGYKDLLSTVIPADFFRFFDKGINDYLVGDWKSAKTNLESCMNHYSYDKPLKFIYNYMKQFKFKAPKRGENRWQGKREID